MEEATGKHKAFRRDRLLAGLRALLVMTALVPLSTPVFAARAFSRTTPRQPDAVRFDDEQAAQLSVQPQAAYFFTDAECQYVLELPHLAPSLVGAELDEALRSGAVAGVRVLSSKKEEFVAPASAENEAEAATAGDGAITGTRLSFSFSFANAGTVALPPLALTVANRRYRIAFAPANVYENPATLQPELSVSVGRRLAPAADGAYRLVFALARYAAQTRRLSLALSAGYGVCVADDSSAECAYRYKKSLFFDGSSGGGDFEMPSFAESAVVAGALELSYRLDVLPHATPVLSVRKLFAVPLLSAQTKAYFSDDDVPAAADDSADDAPAVNWSAVRTALLSGLVLSVRLELR